MPSGSATKPRPPDVMRSSSLTHASTIAASSLAIVDVHAEVERERARPIEPHAADLGGHTLRGACDDPARRALPREERSTMSACPLACERKGDDPVAFVVSENLHRRHLSESQRGMIAERLATLRNGQHAPPIGGATQADAAALLNVGLGTHLARHHMNTVIDQITDRGDFGAPTDGAPVQAGRVSGDGKSAAGSPPKEPAAEIVTRDAARTRATYRQRHSSARVQQRQARVLTERIGRALGCLWTSMNS